jgi:hypothetical protein
MTEAIRPTAVIANQAADPSRLAVQPAAPQTAGASAPPAAGDRATLTASAQGSVPASGLQLHGDDPVMRTNFRNLIKHGTGLGDPGNLETAGTGQTQFLPANSHGAGRVLEAWSAVIQPALTAETNHGRIEQIQERLNDTRAAQGLPALQVDGKMGPKTLWAVHQEMEANHQRISERATWLSTLPDHRSQTEIAQLKVELTNAGTLNRAATALGTDHNAWNVTMELLSSMDDRMPPQVAGYKPNPY